MKKTVLITGAAGGLGLAVGTALARDGWQLVVASRDAERLRAAYGPAHLQIAADCSTAAGAREILAQAKAQGQSPGALVHCAGNIRLGALHRMAEADYDSCIAANLSSAFHTLAAFTGALRADQEPGAAVLFSSAAARVGTPNHEAVAAAKAGVEGLVRGAAATYAASGIRINAVAPGIMDSPATAGMLGNATLREAAARQYPLPGIGSTGQLAELVAWLLSPAAERVTGQVWSVDGGFSAIRPLVK